MYHILQVNIAAMWEQASPNLLKTISKQSQNKKIQSQNNHSYVMVQEYHIARKFQRLQFLRIFC